MKKYLKLFCLILVVRQGAAQINVVPPAPNAMKMTEKVFDLSICI
jgi:hypothetical protein